MEENVPFKVYTYWNEDDKPEVRRFGIEKSVVTSYHYLKAKLQEVFPGLKNKQYTVSWKDEEGDDIVLSSDDEIMIALSAMEDLNLIKLYIYCKDKADNDDCEIVVTAVADNAAGPNLASGLSHYGVVCDGCECAVVGFRYKCTTCDDFDLCSRCEGAGLHPEHCMVRVPMPNMPRTVIRAAIKRSRHFLKTVANSVEQEHCKKQRRERSMERKRRGDHGHGHGHSHGHGHGHRHGHQSGDREHHPRRPHTSWLETFATYMNEFANLAGDVNIDTEKKTAQEQAKNTSQASKEGATTSNERQNQCPFSLKTPDIAEIQKLLNIYVNPKGATENNTSSSAAQPNSETEVKINNDVEMGQGDHIAPEADKESVKTDASSTNSESREESPEIEKGDKTDGWTVINKEKDLMDTYTKAGSSTQPPIGFNLPEEFQERVKISEGQGLYPPLNVATAVFDPKEQEQQSTQPQAANAKASAPPTEKQEPPKPQPRPRHPLAHIDAAIEQMLAMGFTNDGGWLTQLLESKNGNIAAVLDLLTPVNLKK